MNNFTITTEVAVALAGVQGNVVADASTAFVPTLVATEEAARTLVASLNESQTELIYSVNVEELEEGNTYSITTEENNTILRDAVLVKLTTTAGSNEQVLTKDMFNDSGSVFYNETGIIINNFEDINEGDKIISSTKVTGNAKATKAEKDAAKAAKAAEEAEMSVEDAIEAVANGDMDVEDAIEAAAVDARGEEGTKNPDGSVTISYQ